MRMLFVFGLAVVLQAASPTELTFETVASALADARQLWGATPPDTSVEVRLDSLNSCDLKPGQEVETARIQVVWSVSTMHFDDGSLATDARGNLLPVTRKYVDIIRINSSCDWSKLNLRNTVIHEYGHVLLGAAYHSKDPHSVMFRITAGEQAIMPADRKLLAAAVAQWKAVASESDESGILTGSHE